MVIGIGDTVTVTNTVGTDALDSDALGVMAFYARQQATRQEELDTQALIFAVAAIAQLIYYWDKLKDHTKDRDCAIGKFAIENQGMLGFMAELENYRDTVDIKILRDKARIKDQINFGEFEPKSCDTALLYYDDIENDAKVINRFEKMFADCSCSGIPEGWATHDGSFARGLAASFSGPIANSFAVDLYEDFKVNAVAVVQKAQMAMKAIYNISGIMRYYEQAINIHEGLATLFIQGFNSAGAMLGTALGQLANSNTGNANTGSNVPHITQQAKFAP